MERQEYISRVHVGQEMVLWTSLEKKSLPLLQLFLLLCVRYSYYKIRSLKGKSGTLHVNNF